MKLGLHIVAFALLVISVSCYREIILPEETEALPYELISFDGISAFVDNTEGFMLYTVASSELSSFSPLVEFDHYESVILDGKELSNGELNNLGPVEYNRPYSLIAVNGILRDSFELLFTPLPLISIFTEETIPDEPKVLSLFELHYSDGDGGNQTAKKFESYAGIEIRGKTSTRYDKKNFGLELWNNRYGKDRSAPLLGMRYCEDWILDAMFIDALRVRNKMSFELWNKIREDSDEKTGIQMEYVELFVNNRYHGLYCLGEKMDETLIGFSSYQEEKGGVMYKAIEWEEGSTTFEQYTTEPPLSLYWSGWEQIYPDSKFMWSPLDELRKTVVTADDESFSEKIGTILDLDNASDYYLFLNLLLAYDNTGKNLYYARYTDQSPITIIPWDVEASWGKMFNMENSLTAGILGNNLFDRLIELNVDGFADNIQVKWEEYRLNEFSYESLLDPISNYFMQIKESGAIEREKKRWGDPEIDYDYEYAYISNWIEERLVYLDNYFN